jgi:transcription termination factor Rho
MEHGIGGTGCGISKLRQGNNGRVGHGGEHRNGRGSNRVETLFSGGANRDGGINGGDREDVGGDREDSRGGREENRGDGTDIRGDEGDNKGDREENGDKGFIPKSP